MASEDWVLVNEYGTNCKAYVDRASALIKGARVQLLVKHYADPPATDKRTNRAVRELYLLREYDTQSGQVCTHELWYRYLDDGTVSERMQVEQNWAPADKGTQTELVFARTLVGNAKKKSWWPF